MTNLISHHLIVLCCILQLCIWLIPSSQGLALSRTAHTVGALALTRLDQCPKFEDLLLICKDHVREGIQREHQQANLDHSEVQNHRRASSSSNILPHEDPQEHQLDLPSEVKNRRASSISTKISKMLAPEDRVKYEKDLERQDAICTALHCHAKALWRPESLDFILQWHELQFSNSEGSVQFSVLTKFVNQTIHTVNLGGDEVAGIEKAMKGLETTMKDEVANPENFMVNIRNGAGCAIMQSILTSTKGESFWINLVRSSNVELGTIFGSINQELTVHEHKEELPGTITEAKKCWTDSGLYPEGCILEEQGSTQTVDEPKSSLLKMLGKYFDPFGRACGKDRTRARGASLKGSRNRAKSEAPKKSKKPE